ncbi:hypothetical protein H5410_020035 [Solanum commersonii]|uniref:Uncharacterized protein n=1 Tax=Solanum commersonii TaxID=4109 RepID=A0A9J5Z7Y4_SOLCO|nr:hypothetical protein H5410_020035 [Solanum commersonii]
MDTEAIIRIPWSTKEKGGGYCSGEEEHRGNHADTSPQLTREQYAQFVELL